MKLLDAVDKVNEIYGNVFFIAEASTHPEAPNEYLIGVKQEIFDALDYFSKDKALFTKPEECASFHRGIMLYQFSEMPSEIIFKLISVSSQLQPATRIGEQLTIDDFCCIEERADKDAIFFERKGDVNLIQGGFFYRKQKRHPTPDEHQLRYTAKVSYGRASMLTKSGHVETVLQEIIKRYDEIELGFRDIADTFFFRD